MRQLPPPLGTRTASRTLPISPLGRESSFSSALSPAARRRLAADEVVSSEAIKAVYGATQWRRDFRPLRSVDARLRATIWNALPECPFKRFQEIFCLPEDRILPQFTYHGGRISWVDLPNPQKLTLRGCLVSVDRIPEKLVEDLGLVVFTEGQTPAGRIKEKARLSVVLGLMLAFESSREVDQFHPRVRRLEHSSEELKRSYPAETRPISKERYGELLVTRHYNDSNDQYRLILQRFRSGYAAVRASSYIHRSQDKEPRELGSVTVRIEFLANRLLNQWDSLDADGRANITAKIKETSITLIQKFEHCTNKEKVRARELIDAAKECRDSRRVTNILATATRLRSACLSLRRRVKNVGYIAGNIRADELMLAEKVSAGGEALRLLGEAVQEAVAVVNLKPKMSPNDAVRQGQVDGIFKRAGLDLTILTPHLLIAPYRAFCTPIEQAMHALRHTLLSSDFEASKIELVKLHVLSKFGRAVEAIEELRLTVAKNPDIPPGELANVLNDVIKAFSEREVFPDIRTAALDVPYRLLRTEMTRTSRVLKVYETRGLDATARTQMYDRLKVYLDSVDVPHALYAVATMQAKAA